MWKGKSEYNKSLIYIEGCKTEIGKLYDFALSTVERIKNLKL